MSTTLYLSLAHGDAEITRFLEAARATLREDARGEELARVAPWQRP